MGSAARMIRQKLGIEVGRKTRKGIDGVNQDVILNSTVESHKWARGGRE